MDFKKWGNCNWNSESEAEFGFLSYFHFHYKKLLDKIADCPYNKIDFTDKEKCLIGFMRDDLNGLFEPAYEKVCKDKIRFEN